MEGSRSCRRQADSRGLLQVADLGSICGRSGQYNSGVFVSVLVRNDDPGDISHLDEDVVRGVEVLTIVVGALRGSSNSTVLGFRLIDPISVDDWVFEEQWRARLDDIYSRPKIYRLLFQRQKISHNEEE